MRTLFLTKDISPNIRFRRWREAVAERIEPLVHTRLDEGTFDASLEAADIGGLLVTRMTTSAVRSELIPAIRRHDGGTLVIAIMLAGRAVVAQDEREAIHRPGEIVVIDKRPSVIESERNDRALLVEVPRETLERVLGPARQYTALSIGAGQGTTALATSFFRELVEVHRSLDAERAERMVGVGVDLVVASIAERLARDTPKPLYGNVVVQRAKAYIEANLGDHTLDPPRLAAALTISLRQLQILFHARGRHIADWIWERRLETAARRLGDPGLAHVAIGTLSYGCGFVNQAHFSKRFRDRFGLSPREYRRAALTRGA